MRSFARRRRFAHLLPPADHHAPRSHALLLLLLLTISTLLLLSPPCTAVSVPSYDPQTHLVTVSSRGYLHIDLDQSYPVDSTVLLEVYQFHQNGNETQRVYQRTATVTAGTLKGVDFNMNGSVLIKLLDAKEGEVSVKAWCDSEHCKGEKGEMKEREVTVEGVKFVKDDGTGQQQQQQQQQKGKEEELMIPAPAGKEADSAAGTEKGELEKGTTPAAPTKSMTNAPTMPPSPAPVTSQPTQAPITSDPTKQPTVPPTMAPSTASPTTSPTVQPTANTRPTVSFSPLYASSMILQRAPSSSIITGYVEKNPRIRLTGIEVDVTVQGTESHLQTHIVPATILPDPSSGGTRAKFTAMLPPIGITSNVVNTLKRTSPTSHSYSIYARCKSGCLNDPQRSNVAKIHDVKFGDVYVCLGEEEMAQPLEYTFGRNASMGRIQHGGYGNIRYMSWVRNGATKGDKGGVSGGSGGSGGSVGIPWSKPAASLQGHFRNFSAACYYFAESLVDELGIHAPPIGLVEVAYDEARIEDFVDDASIHNCTDTLPRLLNGGRGVFDRDIQPLAEQLSIKGWVYSQGTSNMVGRFGNATSGYACLMPKLIDLYRSTWSGRHPGTMTTSPNAPFGIVALHPSGAGGLSDVGGMRWAQTGGYGSIPNVAMSNTFFASTYDLNDPFDETVCYDRGCCEEHIVFGSRNDDQPPPPKHCQGGGCAICGQCEEFCAELGRTNYYIGPQHPRAKKPVGERLARSAAVEVYGKPGDGVGPTLAGCRTMGDGTIMVHFKRKLLGGEQVIVRDYDRSWHGHEPSMSKMEVLVNPGNFCFQTKVEGGKVTCVDDRSESATSSGGAVLSPKNRDRN